MSDSQAEGLPAPRRRVAILAILLTISTITMDSSAINVALPEIGETLGVAPREVTVVVGVYQLIIVACLFPIASLSEILGYRRVYLCGLAVFVVGAALNALAGSLEMLVTTRALQALGAACVMSVNLAMLRYVVPASHLGRSIGVNAMAVALSTTAGPAIAGWLLGFLPWNAVVMLGVPTGLIGLVLAVISLPESEKVRRSFDGKSALLSAAAFGFFTYSLVLTSREGGAFLAIVMLTVGLLSGVALFRRQRGSKTPLVPLDLFKQPAFSLSVATSICAFSTQMLAYVSLPFALQVGMSFTSAETGLILSAWPFALLFTAPVAARLADTRYNGRCVAAGLGMMALGMVLLSLMPADTETWGVCLRLAVCGVGFSLFQTPNNHSLMGAAPRYRGSAASSSLATARLLGQALGTSLAAIGLTFGPGGALHGLLLGAVLSGGGLIIALVRYRMFFAK